MLELLDLSKNIEDKQQYKQELKNYQLELLKLAKELDNLKIPCIAVFEGWDASGKGGTIKRIVERIDPRLFEIHAISAPDSQEERHHYFHRFWKRLPYKGKMAIFDRSWYGRVLVERVEGFASKEEWERAYDEINQFEKWLTDDGYIIIKFWMHISKDEQFARFKERMENPFKKWKITDEDWRNREKWEEYEMAAEDMFQKTSTSYAPWQLIEGNNKWYARVKVLKIFTETIRRNLDLRNNSKPIT
ncbi:polyphosphate kinase 2 family protein [Bacillus dakarensis]|uniref:polyphosphate kinase 2 family protein n=1 Tax=Robertmurraya dakarensis TaxID=1926278 RepID=UPI000981CCBE|nr:UDP-galactose-lipid carrier transferase [Bacillus dakarensis]